MKIDVQLFARARDIAGVSHIKLEVPEPGRVGELKNALGQRFPELSPLIPALLVAVDMNYADDQTLLDPSSQVACFPPVSGG